MSTEFYGWTGKHIRVDLTNSNIQVVEGNPEIVKNYLGARGIGIKYMMDEIDPKIDAFEKMASREGFGWILGEGSYRLAGRYDHPELSMTVKKQELPNYDPRGVKGQGLAFVTNNRGADHCRAEVNCSEIYETTMLGY
jgi:aldehyde:ferredoxin oxidoreductase